MKSSHDVRTIVSLFGLVVVLHGAGSLLTETAEAADVCCSVSDDCPSNMECMATASPCSLEAEGTCIPIPRP